MIFVDRLAPHESPRPPWNAERTCTLLRRVLRISEAAFVLVVIATALWPGWWSVQWIGWTCCSTITLRIVLSVWERRRRRELPPQAPRRRARPGISIALPWQASKALFKPAAVRSGRDELLERIAFWRSAAGLLTVTLATRGYRSAWDNLGEALEKARMNAIYAMCAAPVVLVVLHVVTRPEFRHRVRSGILGLLKRLGHFALSIAALVGAAAGGVFLLPDDGRPGQVTELTEAWQVWLMFAVLLLVAWGTAYVTCTTYWAARTCFWTSEVHPLFAPSGSALLAAAVFAVELAGNLAAKAPADRFDGVPVPLWLTLNLCGLATTLLLAVAEYRHILGKGVGWTTGPDPAVARTGS